MWKLLYDAWTGWMDYVYHGKYAALLFLVLLSYWFAGHEFGWDKLCGRMFCESQPGRDKPSGKRSGKKGLSALMGYTAFMVVCCIFPVTAALLMQYQTRFYDYQWIWSYVPLTLVTALGGTVYLASVREKSTGIGNGSKPGRAPWQCFRRGNVAASAALAVGLVLLCGLLHAPVFDASGEKQEREAAAAVLEELAAGEALSGRESEICLWAPREILAWARAACPQIRLLYGRDMWDPALGAYTYDTYGETEETLYHWMDYAEQFGALDGYKLDGTLLPGVSCMEAALEAGVNCILLPGNLQEEALAVLEAVIGQEAEVLAGYYVFVL